MSRVELFGTEAISSGFVAFPCRGSRVDGVSDTALLIGSKVNAVGAIAEVFVKISHAGIIDAFAVCILVEETFPMFTKGAGIVIFGIASDNISCLSDS